MRVVTGFIDELLVFYVVFRTIAKVQTVCAIVLCVFPRPHSKLNECIEKPPKESQECFTCDIYRITKSALDLSNRA